MSNLNLSRTLVVGLLFSTAFNAQAAKSIRKPKSEKNAPLIQEANPTTPLANLEDLVTAEMIAAELSLADLEMIAANPQSDFVYISDEVLGVLADLPKDGSLVLQELQAHIATKARASLKEPMLEAIEHALASCHNDGVKQAILDTYKQQISAGEASITLKEDEAAPDDITRRRRKPEIFCSLIVKRCLRTNFLAANNVAISRNLCVGGNERVRGNLTVNGTITGGTIITPGEITCESITVTGLNKTVTNGIVNTGTITSTGNISTDGDFIMTVDPSTAGRILKGSPPVLFIHDTGSTTNFFGGDNAGNNAVTGIDNTGLGSAALTALTSGLSNTAIGFNTLASLNTGIGNTAVGSGTLVAVGAGIDNTVVGSSSGNSITSGISNTIIGSQAGNLITSNNNIVIGANAANASTGTNNIAIGNNTVVSGVLSNTIAIGEETVHVGCSIAGIATHAQSGGSIMPVNINTAGRLGVPTSSRRFKENIEDMGTTSSNLLKLRPVIFNHKADIDPAKALTYGLIAEEVAEVYPELVGLDKEGKPLSINYSLIISMLLNELQKQHRDIEELKQANNR